MNPRRISINGVDFNIATPERPGSPILEHLERDADRITAVAAAHRDPIPDLTPEENRATACGGVLLPFGAVLVGLSIVAAIIVVGS